MTNHRLSRRAVLRGVSATLALPLFPSLARAGLAPEAPLRLAFVYVPNGVHMPDWLPPRVAQRAKRGRAPLPAELPRTLHELDRHRAKLTLLEGLTVDKARANGDGPGDHARACAAYLTGTQPVKADGSVIRVGVSADQAVAGALGDRTRFHSLQLGIEGGLQSGQCDSGYPCAYSGNLSWASAHTPLVHETKPRVLFDRLFGSGLAHLSEEERERRTRERKSILDFVRRDANRLARELSAADRRKLDEYLTGVRELEQRIDRTTGDVQVELERPAGTPRDYADHVNLMFELLALAFATDSTRVATFMLANEGSNRTYRELELQEGHHSLSHHGNEDHKQTSIAAINRHHLRLFGGFLDRLAVLEEDGEPLLDRTLVVYGSGIADGNAHAHHDLPQLLAGGGGRLPLGEHLWFERDTPLANFHRSLFDTLGVDGFAPEDSRAKRFADSTETLDLRA
ncbi:MAG: DUF1552 domain-containing protein [Planctomycetes bacterium]|nr:DUF1552 domain-containing protein [Planctomycetota bacterium]MCB9904245.1 DUF1552 domain-containing protein [Planctomycetota bacterium]